MSLSAATPPTPELIHWTVASSRGARLECPLPTTRPTALPGPHTHLQPTAATGTSRGGQRESRRGPAAADSCRSPPSPSSDKPQTSEAESHELVPLTTTSSRAPGTAANDKEHGRPAPFATAPSYCFTPAERAGGPPSTASANHASPPRAGPNLLASLCGARAERRRAHVLSRPESRGTGTGVKPGRESADLTSQEGCLSPAPRIRPLRPSRAHPNRSRVAAALCLLRCLLGTDFSGLFMLLRGREF